MSDFVRQSNKAKLKSQQPVDLLKINGYLSLWGLCLAGMCFAYTAELGATAIALGCGVILLTIAGNMAVYARHFGLRLFGYAVNIGFHAVVVISMLVVVYNVFADAKFHSRYGSRGPLAAIAVLGIVWYYNPFVRVLKTDLQLQRLERAGDEETLPPADAKDDYDAPADWDRRRGGHRRG